MKSAEETQRLLYVAVTRARAKLYLPFLDHEATIDGGYDALNRRLYAMEQNALLMGLLFDLIQ